MNHTELNLSYFAQSKTSLARILFTCFFAFLIYPSFGQVSPADSIKAQVQNYSADNPELDQQLQYIRSLLPSYQNQPIGKAELIHQLALKHHNAGQLDSCKHFIDFAIDLRLKHSAKPLHLGRSLFLAGANYKLLYSYRIAENYLKDAIEVFLKGNEESRAADVHMDLARLYKREGNYEAALFNLNKARDIYEASEALFDLLISVQIEGAIYDDLDRNQLAESRYKNALRKVDLEVADKNLAEAFKAGIYNNLGLLLLKTNEYDTAEHYLKRAQNAFNIYYTFQEDAYILSQIVNVQANLAKLYNKTNAYQLALEASSHGLQVGAEAFATTQQTILAELYQHRALAFAKSNRHEEAQQAIDRAYTSLIPTFEGVLSQAILKEAPIISRLTLLGVIATHAEVLIALEKPKEALQRYEMLDFLVDQIRLNNLLQEDRHTIQKRSSIYYEAAINLAFELCQHEPEYCKNAYHFIAKNKANFLLQDIQSRSIKTYSDVPDDILIKEERLRQQILEYETSEERNQITNIDNAKHEYFEFLQQVKKDYPVYYNFKYTIDEPLDVMEVQSMLPQNTLLLDFFVGQENIFTFAISNSGYSLERAGTLHNFKKLCQELRTAIELQKKDQAYLDPAYLFYTTLLEPSLEKHSGKERLIIIQDQTLNNFAFETLLTQKTDAWLGKQNPYLLKEYAISYLYSNHFLKEKTYSNSKTAQQPYAGFGLEYDDLTLRGAKAYSKEELSEAWSERAIGQLFYTNDEILESQKIWGGQVWLNEQATRTTFFENGLDARILHFAMHGLLDENKPLNSALVFHRKDSLSEFLLKAGNLYQTSLAAELAVLSACQTAYEGANDHVYSLRSLARAFTYAGCKSLVASLWNATDKSSKEIVIDYYKQLQEGLPKDIALQRAKLKYLEETPPAFGHPFYWAPLIQTGSTKAIRSNSGLSFVWVGGVGVLAILLTIFWWRRKT